MNKTSYNAIADTFRQARAASGTTSVATWTCSWKSLNPAPPCSIWAVAPAPRWPPPSSPRDIACWGSTRRRQLAHARREFPKQRWIEARLETYACAERYQGALLWDSLFHLERRWHATLLARVIAGLPQGGRLMLTAGGSVADAFVDTMFNQPFFYDSHPPEELRALLLSQGVRILIEEFLDLPDGGRNRGRCAFVVEKL